VLVSRTKLLVPRTKAEVRSHTILSGTLSSADRAVARHLPRLRREADATRLTAAPLVQSTPSLLRYLMTGIQLSRSDYGKPVSFASAQRHRPARACAAICVGPASAWRSSPLDRRTCRRNHCGIRIACLAAASECLSYRRRAALRDTIPATCIPRLSSIRFQRGRAHRPADLAATIVLRDLTETSGLSRRVAEVSRNRSRRPKRCSGESSQQHSSRVDPPAGGRSGGPRHAAYRTGIIASAAEGPKMLC
jgi:hypothetical protein